MSNFTFLRAEWPEQFTEAVLAECNGVADSRCGLMSTIYRYQAHGRINDGERELMIDAAYAAWRQDGRSGRTSVLIAADRGEGRLPMVGHRRGRRRFANGAELARHVHLHASGLLGQQSSSAAKDMHSPLRTQPTLHPRRAGAGVPIR